MNRHRRERQDVRISLAINRFLRPRTPLAGGGGGVRSLAVIVWGVMFCCVVGFLFYSTGAWVKGTAYCGIEMGKGEGGSKLWAGVSACHINPVMLSCVEQ